MTTHRRHSLRVLLIPTVLLMLFAHSAVTTATPPACPTGQVWLEPPGMCVPESQAPASPQASDTAPGNQPAASLWDLDTGATIAPDTLPVQQAAAKGAIGSLTLWHFACDAGTDPRQSTPDRLAACTGAGKPAAEYEFYSGATAIGTVSLQTTDGAMGQTTWSSTADQPIAAGNLQFLVRPQEWWESTWVTCRIIDVSGKQDLRTPGLNGTAFAIIGDPGDSITCAWFLVATATGNDTAATPEQGSTSTDTTTDTSTDTASTSGTLTISFLGCPESVTKETDQATLEQACTPETEERSFIITTDGDTTTGSTTGTGNWTFAASISVDIGLAHDNIPHCSSSWPATTGAEAAPRDTFDTVDGKLTITVGHPNTTVTCAWFVFQT